MFHSELNLIRKTGTQHQDEIRSAMSLCFKVF